MTKSEQIRRLAAEGLSVRAIADRVGISYQHAYNVLRQSSITPDSRATPKIWENWADFTKRMKAEEASAKAMLDAAKAGKTDAYEAAIDKLKSRCSSCHLTYGR